MALELAAASLLGAGFTQADRLLDLTTPLGQDKLLAERLQGTEQLSDGGFVVKPQVNVLVSDVPILATVALWAAACAAILLWA